MEDTNLAEIQNLKNQVSNLNLRNRKLEYCLKTAIEEIRMRDRALAQHNAAIQKISQAVADNVSEPIAPLSNSVVDILMNYNGISVVDQICPQVDRVVNDAALLVAESGAVFPSPTVEPSLNTSLDNTLQLLEKPFIKLEKSENNFSNQDDLFNEYSELKFSMDPTKNNDDNFGQGFRCKVCRRTLFTRKSFLKHVLAHSSGSASSTSVGTSGANIGANLGLTKRDVVCRFKCEQCDYRALDRSRLIRHMRRHTGERPFPCDLCSYKATQSSSLARHRRQHTGERPYHCDLCDYRASQATTLNTHRLKHSRDRILYCGRCDYKTVLVHNMDEHKRVSHGAGDTTGLLTSTPTATPTPTTAPASLGGVGPLDIVGTVEVGVSELLQADAGTPVCENL